MYRWQLERFVYKTWVSVTEKNEKKCSFFHLFIEEESTRKRKVFVVPGGFPSLMGSLNCVQIFTLDPFLKVFYAYRMVS